MKVNDVISLIIDCNHCQISIINERTETKQELAVDTKYCALPWQLQVILLDNNTRIRILSTETITELEKHINYSSYCSFD